jgi:hypothetical protein
MMSKVFDEGNLRFDFSGCGTTECFDVKETNPYGMKAVDFVTDATDCVYFLEVKDYQNPSAPQEQRNTDFQMLISAGIEKNSLFIVEMGEKIKDSLLRQYASGTAVTKPIEYLLLINLDTLGEFERGLLKAKISGHVPTGLNDERFGSFTRIRFDLINGEQLSMRGITCTAIA